MRAAWLRLASLLLVPLAAAGTAEDPEIVDPAGDASPPAANQWGDLTAAWLEEAGDEVTAHIQVSARTGVPPMTAYLVLFDVDDVSWYAAIVYIDNEPSYFYGEWDRPASRPTSEEDATGSVQGTRLTVTFPREGVADENATAMTALEAGVFDYKTLFIVGALPTWLDKATGQRDFLFAPAAVEEDAGGEQKAVPAAPLALVAVGVALAAVAARRR